MFRYLRNLLVRSALRRTCRRRFACTAEPLENKRLLAAADLTIANEMLVEVEPNGANVFISSSLAVVNSGQIGLVAIDVRLEGVLSVDQVFGNADDVLLDLDLLDLNLLPGTIAIGSISGNVSLNHYNTANYLLIKIDPVDAINELSDGNNGAVLSLPQLPTLTTSPGQTIGKTNRPVRVDPGITFTDSLLQLFGGGKLQVSVDNDVSDQNVLSIKRIRTESGVLRRKQNELRLGTEVIGTLDGGTDTHPLVITFSSNVNGDMIEKVASAVSLKGKKGITGTRDVQFFVVEPEIVTGFIATKQVILT